MNGTCPICNRTLKEGERLILEWIDESQHWCMWHFYPLGETGHQHSRFPGFGYHCGEAAMWEPKLQRNFGRPENDPVAIMSERGRRTITAKATPEVIKAKVTGK